MIRVFDTFNASGGSVCPLCRTAKVEPTILAPIPGTEDGNIMEAEQVHKSCYDRALGICLSVFQSGGIEGEQG